MKKYLVKDGNAFYEIDEECVRKKEKKKELKNCEAKMRKVTNKNPRKRG